MSEVKYPNIRVKLSGTDGNAFAVLARVKAALIKNKVPDPEIKMFLDEAKSGDYDHLLATCCDYVEVS